MGGALTILAALFLFNPARAADDPSSLLHFAEDETQPSSLRFAAIQKLAELKSPLTEEAALSFLRPAAAIYAAAGRFSWDPALGDDATLFRRTLDLLEPFATEKSVGILIGFRPVPRTGGNRMFGLAAYPALVSALRRDPRAREQLEKAPLFLSQSSAEHRILLELHLCGDIPLAGHSEKLRLFSLEPFSPELRLAAIEALGKTDIETAENRDRLLELLGDPSVRQRSAWALAQLKENRALEKIYDLYVHAEDENEAIAMVRALLAFKNIESLPYLRFLRRRDRQKHNRRDSAQILAELRGYSSNWTKGTISSAPPPSLSAGQHLMNGVVSLKWAAEALLGVCERALGLSTPERR